MAKKTLFDKVWDSHIVRKIEGGPDILFIDRHLIHEVTSPVAFLNLKKRKLSVRFPERTFATADHNTPTINQHLPIKDKLSDNQLKALRKNTREYGIENYWGLEHRLNGIVHVIGPENGITLPGTTIVCGDSHTSTHGAFGAVAFGIGTSEVAMVLSSQCIMQMKPKKMRIIVNGDLKSYVYPKDVILFIISKLSSSGATGHFVEYAGEVFEQMSMEGRMTVCNMSIEMGARGGIIAPDSMAIDYIKGREFAPKGDNWDKAVEYWNTLHTDQDAEFDKEYTFDAKEIEAMITYGTNPGMGVQVDGRIPMTKEINDNPNTYKKALQYMGFEEGQPLIGKKIDYVFVGSCTNGRIEDFRAFARAVKGRTKSDRVTAWLVPGSKQVEAKIIEEGLLDVFQNAGFQLRQPGCSACLAMNDDKIPSKKYAVSTSNRNFQGRQGPGARTLLASPFMAGIAAITGEIQDPRKFFLN